MLYLLWYRVRKWTFIPSGKIWFTVLFKWPHCFREVGVSQGCFDASCCKVTRHLTSSMEGTLRCGKCRTELAIIIPPSVQQFSPFFRFFFCCSYRHIYTGRNVSPLKWSTETFYRRPSHRRSFGIFHGDGPLRLGFLIIFLWHHRKADNRDFDWNFLPTVDWNEEEWFMQLT